MQAFRNLKKNSQKERKQNFFSSKANAFNHVPIFFNMNSSVIYRRSLRLEDFFLFNCIQEFYMFNFANKIHKLEYMIWSIRNNI